MMIIMQKKVTPCKHQKMRWSSNPFIPTRTGTDQQRARVKRLTDASRWTDPFSLLGPWKTTQTYSHPRIRSQLVPFNMCPLNGSTDRGEWLRKLIYCFLTPICNCSSSQRARWRLKVTSKWNPAAYNQGTAPPSWSFILNCVIWSLASDG